MRRRVLVCYDICDPVRLRRVHKVMLAFGDPVQYSIFLCGLTAREKVLLRRALWPIVHHEHDSVLLIDLGGASDPLTGRWEKLGKAPSPTERRALIV